MAVDAHAATSKSRYGERGSARTNPRGASVTEADRGGATVDRATPDRALRDSYGNAKAPLRRPGPRTCSPPRRRGPARRPRPGDGAWAVTVPTAVSLRHSPGEDNDGPIRTDGRGEPPACWVVVVAPAADAPRPSPWSRVDVRSAPCPRRESPVRPTTVRSRDPLRRSSSTTTGVPRRGYPHLPDVASGWWIRPAYASHRDQDLERRCPMSSRRTKRVTAGTLRSASRPPRGTHRCRLTSCFRP